MQPEQTPHWNAPMTVELRGPSRPAPLRERDLPPRPEHLIALNEVTKRFGDNEVLHPLSLRVHKGEIIGLIGPSGCGKTTLIRIMLGLTNPSSGEVEVLGCEPRNFGTAERMQIGYAPQGFNLFPTLTVRQNASFIGGLYGLGFWQRHWRVREMLGFLEIWDARNRLARDISGGMQRRLTLACALLHHPTLLFVDEPTAGLDPALREKIWNHLEWFRDRGATVLVTTQYIDEAAHCDSVAVMRDGSVVAHGHPEELRRRAFGGEALDVRSEDGFTRDDVVKLYQLDAVRSIERGRPNVLRVWVDDSAEATPDVTGVLHERGKDLCEVRPYVPTYDEVFLRLTAGGDERE
jgi:ABC-2 type transport system ATP-binding protein